MCVICIKLHTRINNLLNLFSYINPFIYKYIASHMHAYIYIILKEIMNFEGKRSRKGRKNSDEVERGKA